jgi:hypothetical protein
VVDVKTSPVLDIPILPGMREDIDPRAGATPGTLRLAENIRFRKTGMAQKRAGTSVIGTAGDTAAHPIADPIEFVGTLGGAPFIGGRGFAHAYDATEQEWRKVGVYSSAMPVRRELTMFENQSELCEPTNGAATVAVDSAGYMLAAYCSNESGSGTCFVRYFDPEGNLIQRDSISASLKCIAVAVGATIYLLVQEFGVTNTDVVAYTYTAGARTGPSAALFTLDSFADAWDANVWDNAAAGRWLISWWDSSSTTVTVRRLNALATEGSATFNLAGITGLAVYGNTDMAWLGTADGGTVDAQLRGWDWSGSFSLTYGPETFWTWTAPEGGSPPIPGPGTDPRAVTVVGWLVNDSAIGNYTFAYGYGNDTGSGSAASFTLVGSGTFDGGIGYPVSRPFGDTGEYVWINAIPSLDATDPGAAGRKRSVLLRRPVAFSGSAFSGGYGPYYVDLVADRQRWLLDNRTHRWSSVARYPNGDWLAALSVFADGDGDGAVLWEALRFQAPHEATRQLADAPSSVMIPGQPTEAIAGDIFDSGWPTAPTISYAAAVGAGAMVAGDYALTACFAFVDTGGRISRSAAAPPVTVTVATNERIQVIIDRTAFRRGSYESTSATGVLEIYATKNGDTGIYRLLDASNYAEGERVSFIADYLDADLDGKPFLYSVGALGNDSPPACRIIVDAEDRVFCGPLWDRTLWQASKLLVPGEPALFSDSDAFKIRFPEDTVTGCYMDGALIVFSESAVYAVTGAGPNDQGAGEFSPPRRIVSGLGCVNERSVVVTPIGVFFESRRGIELLPRGLGVPEFVGAAVQDQLAARPTILDSAMHVGDDATTVRFLVKDPTALPQEFDAAAGGTITSASGVSGSDIIISATHALGAGANRVVVAAVGLDLSSGFAYTPNTATMTYNGIAMTRFAEVLPESNPTTRGIVLFVMLEAALPAAGNYTVVATVPTGGTPSGTSTGVSMAVISRLNAEQVTPTLLGQFGSSGLGTRASTVVAADPFAAIVDFVHSRGTVGSKAPDASQTERVDETGSSQQIGSSEIQFGEFASGNVTMGWTFSDTQSSLVQAVVGIGAESSSSGRRTLVFDLDAKAWSVDSHPINPVALGVTPLGLLFASEDTATSPAFLLEDSSLSTDNGSFFESRLQFHDFQVNGFAGVAHVDKVIARVLLNANPSTVNIQLSFDGVISKLSTISGTDTSRALYYGAPGGPISNQATAVQLEAYDSAGSVSWLGFVLLREIEPDAVRSLVYTEVG